MAIGIGYEDRALTEGEVREVCAKALGGLGLRGKRVLLLVPDHTRTAPVGLMFRTIYDLVGEEAAALDVLIALGTHPAMSEEAINERLELTPEERTGKYGKVRVFNHEWDQPEMLREIGRIAADEVEALTGGLFREEVPVAINRRLLDYDQVIIVGPTFPHEVVGFSGGDKYIFPGVAGPEIIHFFHWLGAVITNPVINGTKATPVRAIIERAASMLSVPRFCLSLVVHFGELKGLYAGAPPEAFSRAADLSSKLHVVWVERPFKRALGIAPAMYDDLWVAGKVMYKLEPVLADGAELVIYAPHITEVSYTHGRILDEVGYHVRDYFRKQWDRFRDYPRGVLAHSTHVKGIGTFEGGVERPRVEVALATGIPEERCRRINLGWRDPAGVDPGGWADREAEGVLLVRKAGEMLYRLWDGTVPRIPGDPDVV
jgi:nickel-dependent lactate racemase